MDVTVQRGMRQERVVASFCAHWPSQCWHPPCRPAVRPLLCCPDGHLTQDVPGSSSLTLRIFKFVFIYLFIFLHFCCVPLQSCCAWLRRSAVCLLLLVCVSACQGEQELQLAPSRVVSNTPITNYYATATLTDARSHRGPEECFAIVRLSSPPSGLPTQSGWELLF